jgi:hypothetical protein
MVRKLLSKWLTALILFYCPAGKALAEKTPVEYANPLAITGTGAARIAKTLTRRGLQLAIICEIRIN